MNINFNNIVNFNFNFKYDNLKYFLIIIIIFEEENSFYNIKKK